MIIHTATSPGEFISVDQLTSPTLRFVPIHRGTPTDKTYIGATIFVTHFSDYTYAHLMTKMDAESTVVSKIVFKNTLFLLVQKTFITMPTIVYLTLVSSRNLSTQLARPYHFVVSTPTIKMVKLSNLLVTLL